MRTFDLSPLWRTSVGFDRLADLFETAFREEGAWSYPPYNIEKIGDYDYRISMAVAGFREDDLDLWVQNDVLVVSGKPAESDQNKEYLYKGIAGRAFERRFHLADHVKVKEARLQNGLLEIDLVLDLPEAMRPRQIPISTGKTIEHKKVIEHQAA